MSASREAASTSAAAVSAAARAEEPDNNDSSLANDSRNEHALSAEIQSIIERIQNNGANGSAADASQRYQSRSGANTRFDNNDSDEREDDEDVPG